MPDFTSVDNIVFKMSFVVIVFCLYIVIYSVMKLCEETCKVNVSKIQTKLARATMFAILFSFQSVVSTLLKLIQCVSLGGKDVLLIDASYQCFTSWQIAVCVYVGACVVPFTLYMYRGVTGGGAVRRVRLRHKANQPVLDSRRRRRPGVNNTGTILMDLFAIY